jgi:AraC-like DNA-binding protein
MDSYRTVFTTDRIPARERFSYWQETLSAHLMPVEAKVKNVSSFSASITTVALGTAGAYVSEFRHPPFDAFRTQRMINRSDPGVLLLGLVIDGETFIEQRRQGVAQSAMEMAVYDSSRPFRVLRDPSSEDGPRGTGFTAILPRSLVASALPPGRIDQLLATKIPTHEGIGALLRHYLVGVVRNSDRYTPLDRERIGSVTTDLILATLAHRLDPDDATILADHRLALRARIEAFIRQHLSDPDLTPTTVAAAANISRRELDRVFQEGGGTSGVADWIRWQRLELGRRELSDPTVTRTIRAIAERAGFTHPEHFSRMFRATYKESPKDYRDRVRDKLFRA